MNVFHIPERKPCMETKFVSFLRSILKTQKAAEKLKKFQLFFKIVYFL